MKLRTLSILAISGTVGLAACGSTSSGSPSTSTTSSAGATTTMAAGSTMPAATTGTASTTLNAADIVFAQSMIPHHQQAVTMADMALAPNAQASAKVIALATAIKTAQAPEITMMQGWLTAAGQPMTMDTAMGGMSGGATMPGMMSDTDMSALQGLSGTAFDKMWLDMMIRHHQGAITMANTVKAAGSNPDVLALAGKIITGQQAEIDQMKALLAG